MMTSYQSFGFKDFYLGPLHAFSWQPQFCRELQLDLFRLRIMSSPDDGIRVLWADGTKPPVYRTVFRTSEPLTCVGYADVNCPTWVPGTRVFLEGKDISGSCYRAEEYSDGTVVAFCFQRDAQGLFLFDFVTREVARETRRGNGRIVIPQ